VALALPPFQIVARAGVRFWLTGALIFGVCSLRTTAGQRYGASASPVSRTIEGTVLDHTGHPVPGAIVLIEDLKTLQVRSYIVQDDGKYRFRGLSSDANYQLRARLNGVSSTPKTVSVFESHPAIVVNLTLPAKPKRSTPPPAKQPPGNPS